MSHFFDPELRELMIFANSDTHSQQIMEQYVDKNVLPHVVHPGGLDGPVAKGYEHVHMEGGSLPEEEQSPVGSTGIVFSAENGAVSDISASNNDNSSHHDHNNIPLARAATMYSETTRTTVAKATIDVSGKSLFGGRWDLVSGKTLFRGYWDSVSFSPAMVGQEYSALIKVDSGRHMLVDFN